MRRTRLVVMLLLIVGVLSSGVPNASASATFSDGVGYCDDVLNRDACVRVLSERCILWFSFGFGGCWLPR